MRSENHHLVPAWGKPQRVARGRFIVADHYIEVGQKTCESVLARIKIGDRIRGADGRKGTVGNVEVLLRYAEVQYYFRLERGLGTILVIK